jgi:FixJ family two-component response regulator
MPGSGLVVVVDDDASVRIAIARLLAGQGLAVRTFSSASELLAAMPSDVACVVVDVHLGGMNGFELDAELRARGAAWPLVFISAQDDDATRERAARSGAYLRKPFEVTELLQAIEETRVPGESMK